MNQAVFSEKARPLSGLANPIYFEWPNVIDERLQAQLLELTNTILAKETTIGFPGPLAHDEGMALMRDMAASVAAGKKRVMLVRRADNHEVIGQSILTPNTLPNCRHIGEISRTFAHPDYRGVTIIRAGMDVIIAEAERLGLDVIQLDVRAHTRIHKLWEALGFETIGIMRDYARVNGESFDGCFMYQSVAELKRRFESA